MFDGMFHTMLIAKLFGIYLVILGVVMLGQARYYRALVADFASHRHLIFMCAASSLLLGIFLVLIHNVWVCDPRVLVTILGWWIVVKSALWLGAPDTMARCVSSCYAGKGYYLGAIVTLVYGILLMSAGFYSFSAYLNVYPV